jgi:hypothetical protein
MDAQKKLFGLAAQQMKANVKAAGRTMDTMKPMVPVAELTRGGVKSFVDAQKALIDVLKPREAAMKQRSGKRRVRHPARQEKKEAALAARAIA